MESQISPLGMVADGQYVYIGPTSPKPSVGDVLQVGNAAYCVRRIEQLKLGDVPVYTWGLCVKKGGD